MECLESRKLLAADLIGAETRADAGPEGELVSGPWINLANRYSADGNVFVTASDALLVLGARSNPAIVGPECAADTARSFCELVIPKPIGAPLVDVTGDGLWTNSDVTHISAVLSGDAPKVFVSPLPNERMLTTTESGGTALFTVAFLRAPAATATITISSSNTAEGTVSTNLLTFTPANGHIPQKVIVTGVADGTNDGDQGFLIITGDVISGDPSFNGLSVLDVPITNTDSGSSLSLDFGDLPDSFATTLSSDGPRHTTDALFLGDSVDVEANGSPSSDASGDGADEDGVTQISSLVAASNFETTSAFHVRSSLAGKLDAWIDFNGDGSFDHPSEHIGLGTSVNVPAGGNIVTAQIPAANSAGQVAARFRLSSVGGLAPTGAASGGEVEDYFFTMLDGTVASEVLLTPPRGSGALTADGTDVVATTESVEVFRAPGASLSSITAIGNDNDNTLSIANLDAIYSGSFKTDAGGGFDQLVLTGEGQSIDFTALTAGDLTGIESIDLRGTGDNQIALSAGVVETLSNTTDTLKLIYDEGDMVNFNANWTVEKPEFIDGIFQHVMTSGVSRLEITNSFPHQNPLNPLDVNRLAGPTVIDPLIVINTIARGAGGLLAAPTTTSEIPDFYLDVRADNEVTSIDALRIINFLAINGPGSSLAELLVPLRESELTVERERTQSSAIFELVTIGSPTLTIPFENVASGSSTEPFTEETKRGDVDKTAAVTDRIRLLNDSRPAAG